MARSLFARLAHRFGPERTDEDRRALLKATLLASAGMLLSGPSALGRMMRAPNGKKVCIVGGGFAGLACAHELAAAGYAVIVIEARNRVGGRVLTFSDFVKGRIIEGGGELIGSNHPTWAAYKEAFGLNYLDVTEAENVEAPIVLNGQRLTAAESEGLYTDMDAALSLMNADAAGIDENEPWNAPNAAALDARSTRDWIRGLDVSALCKMGLAAQLTADNGVSTAKQSYLGNLAQVKGGGLEKYWTDTEVYRCKEGNQALAIKIALELGPERCVVGVPVKTIVAKGLAMEVTCGDGRKVEVDDVVLAVPPSVWKTIEFRPPLPPALAPQMGVNVKYLSSVKSRFWKDKGLSPDALTDGDISMTWDATDNQEGDAGVCLTAFSGGPGAEAVRAKDAEKRKAAYGGALEEMYPGYAENFVDARFMDWPSDPLTQAGYSFPAPGQVTTMGPLMAKAQSFGKLHIAGEHACYKFVGYMEGGLNSGVTVARRIAERDGVAKKT